MTALLESATIVALLSAGFSLIQCSGGDSSSGNPGSSGTGVATITVLTPSQDASLPSGPVTVSFAVLNHTIGLRQQPHMVFFVNNDPVPHEFFNGPGITDQDGVLYRGAHTHSVHWQSQSSFQMFGLRAGVHQVKLVLVDAAGIALQNPEATQTVSFTIVASADREFRLEPMLTGLNLPLAMATAPDGRVFYTELMTGNIRVIDTVGGTWQLRSTPFYHLDVYSVTDQGLLGIVLDPAFSSNGYVYVYHTVSDASRNRVVRLKDNNGQGTEETVILDNIPVGLIFHNGGIMRFGPDGKLYITTGDARQSDLAQDLSSLAGKVLRINPDGTVPNDNPFPGSPVYLLGLRHSFGLTFHPHTGTLWLTDNGEDDNDEVNRGISGGNYGWPIVRGIANDPRFVDPLAAFTPSLGITGIVAVGTNSPYPAEYHNNLFFTDANTGQIQRIVLQGADLTERGELSIAFGGGVGTLIDLVEGPGGFLYATSLEGIYQVVRN